MKNRLIDIIIALLCKGLVSLLIRFCSLMIIIIKGLDRRYPLVVMTVELIVRAKQLIKVVEEAHS
jgi:hypothetical protein